MAGGPNKLLIAVPYPEAGTRVGQRGWYDRHCGPHVVDGRANLAHNGHRMAFDNPGDWIVRGLRIAADRRSWFPLTCRHLV
jgi:hypothetical protein